MSNIQVEQIGDVLEIKLGILGNQYIIQADTIVDPDGDRCVIYNNYIVSLHQVSPNATDMNYYLNKIQCVANCIEKGMNSTESISALVKSHILEHSRIIDNDLMMISSATYRTFQAVFGGVSEQQLFMVGLSIVKEEFANSFFITVYKRTLMGIQPNLVPFSEYHE